METTISAEPSIQLEYPTLSDRVQSTFIDTIFIVVLMFICASFLDRYDNAPEWIRIALFFSIWAVYEPLCTTLGFTIGNLIKGIRVRKAGGLSKRINFLQAFVRYVLKISLGWISFLTMHSNKQKRAIHDFAAGSMMIKKY
ncbi:MAG: RDD family protein [Chitinophagaceae bacterium]|nr:MAG: RDD family protein [Chitinophagaceae bacterium]